MNQTVHGHDESSAIGLHLTPKLGFILLGLIIPAATNVTAAPGTSHLNTLSRPAQIQQVCDTLYLDTLKSRQLVHFMALGDNGDVYAYGAIGNSSFVGDSWSTEFPPRKVSGRLYLSINLDQLGWAPDSILIDSAFLYIYQDLSYGNDSLGAFPVFDIPDGDTVRCVLDHIDYGDSLELEEWTVGDPGMAGTLESNMALVSNSPDIGYRVIEVTDAIRGDLASGRNYSQFRIRFTAETDDDENRDLLAFEIPVFGHPVQPRPFLVVYYSITTGIKTEPIPAPKTLELMPPYPNPFNTTVTIPYALPTTTDVTISIYDIQGRLVRRWHRGAQPPSYYRLVWMAGDRSGREVSSGLYLIILETLKFKEVKQIILLR